MLSLSLSLSPKRSSPRWGTWTGPAAPFPPSPAPGRGRRSRARSAGCTSGPPPGPRGAARLAPSRATPLGARRHPSRCEFHHGRGGVGWWVVGGGGEGSRVAFFSGPVCATRESMKDTKDSTGAPCLRAYVCRTSGRQQKRFQKLPRPRLQVTLIRLLTSSQRLHLPRYSAIRRPRPVPIETSSLTRPRSWRKRGLVPRGSG